MQKFCITLLAFLLTACGSSGGDKDNVVRIPTTPPPAAGTVGDGRLDELVEWARATQDVPAMALVLVGKGQIAEMSAVGKRSATADVPVTLDDRWHQGSLTKAMTATLAAIMVEQSVIDWTTRPLDVWPELDQNIQPAFRNITLRHLLSHTSGLVRPDVLPAFIDDAAPGDTTAKRRQWAAELLATPPAGPVGQSRYSNGGYVVAGAMLETLTGTPWETLLHQQVFAPLGMLESGFGAPGDAAQIDQPFGHWDRGNHFEPVPPGPGADNPVALGPAGTVHTTLQDYANFMLAHIAGARGVPGIVSASGFEMLHAPVAGGSALGWGFTPFADWARGPVLSHSGSNARWYTVVRLAPALDAGLLVAVNAGNTRAEAAIDSVGDLILERFEASQ
jgi:CubicO group peptidase (beta-lactamase class C family)